MGLVKRSHPSKEPAPCGSGEGAIPAKSLPLLGLVKSQPLMGLVKRSHSGEESAPCGSVEELTPRGSDEEEPFR